MKTDKKTFDYAYMREVRSRALGRLTWRFKRYMDGFMEPRLHQRGFTDFKLSYLRLLVNIEENGITNNELARKADVTKQMMSKVVNLLETDGYIFTKRDEQDSRAIRIFLSDRGFDLLYAVSECMQEANNVFSGIIGNERLQRLITDMRDLVDGLDEGSCKL